MLLLLMIFGVPSSLNYQDIMYISHLSISHFYPDVYRRYSHVWVACCNLFNACGRLPLFQSFAYCLLSSTNPRIYCIQYCLLSGEFIWYPSHFLSITFIIGTLLKTQLVPAISDPLPYPWIGVSFVDLYVLLETPWFVWILYSMLFKVLAWSLQTWTETPNDLLHRVLRLQIILS